MSSGRRVKMRRTSVTDERNTPTLAILYNLQLFHAETLYDRYIELIVDYSRT